MKTEVLDQDQILRICNRFAFQILENSIDSDVIHIIGVKEKGFDIAKIVERELKSITKKNISLSSIKIDKKNPKDSVLSDSNLNKNTDTIFLIDDVLNTGKTLIYCLSFLLNFNFKSIKTLVLIDRNHKQFPVKVDYKGISLSTNINDNIKLLNENKKLKAILF
tara:strand:+ start:1242 stop:1733 length:492 start_codon:yes stop_codon:yes gene_type:complete